MLEDRNSLIDGSSCVALSAEPPTPSPLERPGSRHRGPQDKGCRKSEHLRPPASFRFSAALNANNVTDGWGVLGLWTAAAAKIPLSVIPKRADVPGMRDFLKARGRLHEMPMAGDLSIWIFSPSMRHIGFVETVAADGRNFTTIEGNVNSSRVVRRDHRVGESGLVGFGRPDYAKVEEDDMPDEKTFKKWVREAVKEELEERWKGVVKGQKNVGGTLAVIADHVDRVLEEVRKKLVAHIEFLVSAMVTSSTGG